MSHRLRRKNLRLSSLEIGPEDLDDKGQQPPSLSSRLRSWLRTSPAKYAKDQQHDAMRAVISLDQLQKPFPARSVGRLQGEGRRQKLSYLQRLNARKRHEIAEKLAASELRQEARLDAIDMFTSAAETAAKQQSAALDQMVHRNHMQIEVTNLEMEERLQTSQTNLQLEMESTTMLLDEARMEATSALEQARMEAGSEAQNETINFEQNLHVNNLATQGRLDELRSTLSARIADLEAACEKMRADNQAQNAHDLQQYRDLIASDAVLVRNIQSNTMAITRIRARFQQLRMANVHFRNAEVAQQTGLRHRITILSRTFRRLQTSMAHWRRSSEAHVKELSLMSFQERTKIKMFVSKTERILKRWAIAGRLDPPEPPGESFETRICKKRWELHLLRQKLQQTRDHHQQLLAELNQMAFESGVPLQKVIQVRDLVSAFGAEGARREMTKSRSCLL